MAQDQLTAVEAGWSFLGNTAGNRLYEVMKVLCKQEGWWEIYLVNRQTAEADSEKPAGPDLSPKPDSTYTETHVRTHTRALSLLAHAKAKTNINL